MKMAKIRFASNNSDLQGLRYLIQYTDCADVQSSASSMCGLSHLTALLSQLILQAKLTEPGKVELGSRRVQIFQHQQPCWCSLHPPPDKICGKEMQIIETDLLVIMVRTWAAAERHMGWGLGKKFEVSANSIGNKHFDR